MKKISMTGSAAPLRGLWLACIKQLVALLCWSACAVASAQPAGGLCAGGGCNPNSQHPLDILSVTDGMGHTLTFNDLLPRDISAALAQGCEFYAQAHSNAGYTSKFDVCSPQSRVPLESSGGAEAPFLVYGTVTETRNADGVVVGGSTGAWALGLGQCTTGVNSGAVGIGTDGQCYCYGNNSWNKDQRRCMPVVEQDETKGPQCGVGNPVQPLVGTKREPVDTGLRIGNGTLVLTYDSSRRSPRGNETIPGPTMVDPAGFGELWLGNHHKLLFVNAGKVSARAARGNGRVSSFLGAGGKFTSESNVTDRLLVLETGFRYVDAGERAMETYDAAGNLRSVAYAGGTGLAYTYSDAQTPTDVAPTPGYLLRVQDTFGRSIGFRYEMPANAFAARVSAISDAAGAVVSVSYDAAGNLSELHWPDGTVKRFVYERSDLPWALTGVVDENTARYSIFGYDDKGRAISTEHAGGVDRYSVTYAQAPAMRRVETYDAALDKLHWLHTWTLPQSVMLTQPNGSSVEWGVAAVNGQPRRTSLSQPAGSGCGPSTSSTAYDSAGNVASEDDFNGTRVCYGHDQARGLERVRVDGLAANVACPALLNRGAAVPAGATKTSTLWHPDWPLMTARSGPGELEVDVYNGQRDPLSGGAARCAPDTALLPDGEPIAVLCKRTRLSTTDADGHQSLADAVAALQASIDPDYASVSTLLHLDGGNGTTAITDDGPAPHAWASIGNAGLSTAQSRFGGASFNPGTGVAVSPVTADHLFGSGDFTVEAWVYKTATPESAGAIMTLWASGQCSWYLGVDSANHLVFFTSTLGNGGFSFPAVGFVPNNTWVHVAAARQGTVLRFFVNGALLGSVPINGALYAPVGSNVTLGAAGDVIQQWPGYIDEVRVTKGVARYTAAFTVPAAAFPGLSSQTGTIPGVDTSVPPRTWSYTYNEFGQVLTATDMDTGATTRAYFADTTETHTMGDLKSITTSSGKVTIFDRYNRYGQVLQSTDENGVVTVNTYDLRQRLLTNTVGSETTTYAYDPVGQLTKVTFGNSTWIGFDHDDAHRRVAIYDNKGNRIDYVLDNAGNRTSERLKNPAGALKRNLARVMDALGRAQQSTGRE